MIAAQPDRRGAVRGSLHHILGHEFVRYFLASLAALVVDLLCLKLLLQTPLYAGVSAAIAYCAGIVVIWLLLSRLVFANGAAQSGRQRTQQKALFLTMAWAGLALTTGIVSLAEFMGANVWLSKGLAIFASFTTNYLVRKFIVFRAPKEA